MMLLLGYGDQPQPGLRCGGWCGSALFGVVAGALDPCAAHPAGRVRVRAERGRPGQPGRDAVGGQAGARGDRAERSSLERGPRHRLVQSGIHRVTGAAQLLNGLHRVLRNIGEQVSGDLNCVLALVAHALSIRSYCTLSKPCVPRSAD